MSDFQVFNNYKRLIEIDYFTLFTKCYFALNSYIKVKFQGNDREKIDQLKEDIKIQNRFNEFFKEDIFIANLKEFKNSLYEAQIINDGLLISFERVKIQAFSPKEIPEIIRNNIIYNLKIVGGKNEKIKFTCLSKKNNSNKQEEKECKYSELEQILNNTDLSKPQRQIIKNSFDEEISQYHQNLNKIIDNINTSSSDEEKKKIYKEFIEIIYLLRNALFHSQINPMQEDIHKVYKLAYILFKDFIYKLPTEVS